MFNFLALNSKDILSFKVLIALNESEDRHLEVKLIQESLRFSNYKMKQLYGSIEDDLAALPSEFNATITQIGSVWRVNNVTESTLRHLLLLYLHRSSVLPVFEYRFFYSHRFSKQQYMAEHYQSNVKYYASEQVLNERLLTEHHDVRLTKDPVDSEFNIRLFLLQCYSEWFGGLEAPFEELDELTSQIITYLTTLMPLHYSPTQLTKLRFFLKIWILRLRDDNVIQPEGMHLIPNEGKLSQLRRVAPELLTLPDIELDYVYTFLIVGRYLLDKDTRPVIEAHRDVFVDADILSHKLMKDLASHGLFNSLSSTDLDNFERIIYRLGVQLTSFYVPQIYTSQNTRGNMRELLAQYPATRQVIEIYMKIIFEYYPNLTDRNALMNIYYTCAFALVSRWPVNQLCKEVNVYVDFSQGKEFTDYMSRLIRQHTSFKLEFMAYLSSVTDIYISDFFNPTFKGNQLIWNGMPSDQEWLELKQLLIDLRGGGEMSPYVEVKNEFSVRNWLSDVADSRDNVLDEK